MNSQSRRVIGSWCLYDFANSAFTTLVVTFVYATYFTRGIAPDETTGTTMWSWAVGLSGLVIALASPWLGARTDLRGRRGRSLITCTIICVLATAALYFPGGEEAGTFDVVLALGLFLIANIAYEIGQALYNAYLPDLAPSEVSGRVSGYGWACGYLGGLGALFLSLQMLLPPEPAEPWFGLTREGAQHVRATNILVAVWFAIFSLPFLLVARRLDREAASAARPLPAGALSSWGRLLGTFRELRRYRQVFRFLLARIFYNDGLVTIIAMGGIYAGVTYGFEESEILVFGIVLNVAAGLGAFALGFLDDLLGGKRTILLSIAMLAIATTIAMVGQSRTTLWVAGFLVGLFMGPNQSASRSFLGRITPSEKRGEFYGFFAFSGKLTSFIGPVGFGLLTALFESQRVGLSVVLVLLVVGGGLLLLVDERQALTPGSSRAPGRTPPASGSGDCGPSPSA